MTWDKAWTKQWLLQNTTISTPANYVFQESWTNVYKWLTNGSCPVGKKLVIKPINLSLSRGVRVLEKTSEGSFLTALGETQSFAEIAKGMLKETNGERNIEWLVEEYVQPIPACMLELCYDLPFNPLVRIIMFEGNFHFGEVHIPTKVSNGRGTLKGGARRLCFDYKGELLQNRPNIPKDHPWSISQYGTKIDVTGRMLPGMQELVDKIREQICASIAPTALFAIDGCYRDTPDGPEFVCVEIEHAPNVKNLANFTGLRCPTMQ